MTSSIKPSVADIEARLKAALPLAKFAILDESHLHAGHEGARGGAGHFRVQIQDPSFEGLALVKRHRLVYDALRDWMPERIHALAIEAST
jgi:BolA family transcriptional regulator, general stress-responsive regulator